MEEIIVIRVIGSDGKIFKALMSVLNEWSVQIVNTSPAVLSFGDVKIYSAY